MKSIRVTFRLWIFFFALALGGSTPHAQTPESMDDSFAAILIGDVRGLVDGIAGIVNLVMPGMGEMVPAQVGGFLGDPDLSGFGPGDGVAGIIFPGDLMVVFAEVASEEHEAYIENAGNLGAQAASVGSLLVLSDDEVGVALGKKIAGEVQEGLLSENNRPSLHALVHIPKVLRTFGSEIDGFLEEFPEMMEAGLAEADPDKAPPKGLTNILEAEVFGLHQIVSQLEIFEVELTPAKEGIGLELSFMPEPGTNLSSLLVDSKGGDSSGLARLVPADGAIRSEGTYDGKAVKAFFEKEMAILLPKLSWTEEEKEDLRELVEMSLDTYGSGFAMTMLVDRPGLGGLFNGYYVYDVEDPSKAIEFFREFGMGTGPMGFSDFYESLGMKLESDFQENVKTHSGVSIHRMTQKIEAVGEEAQQSAGFFDLFSNMVSDIAAVEGYIVVAVGGLPIEEAIDLVQSGGSAAVPPLESRTHFGDGGSVYVDLSVEGYLNLVGAILEETPSGEEETAQVGAILKSVRSAFQGAPPIVKGVFADVEQAKAKLFIPSTLVQRGSQAVMGAMMGAAVSGGG